MKKIVLILAVMFCSGCVTLQPVLTEDEMRDHIEYEELHDLPSTIPFFVWRF
jgi:hypothetical protein